MITPNLETPKDPELRRLVDKLRNILMDINQYINTTNMYFVNGRAGLGTSNPIGKLHIKGVGETRDGGWDSILELEGDTSIVPAIIFGGMADGDYWGISGNTSLSGINGANEVGYIAMKRDGQFGYFELALNQNIGTTGVNVVWSNYYDGLYLNQGFSLHRTTVANTNYTVLPTDNYIEYTSLTAGRTVTLPPAANVGAGKLYIVKDGAGAAAANNITVDGDGAETIDGAATKAINTNYGVMRLVSTGANWMTI